MEPNDAPATATILVVDDHEPNRALARATLEDEGHRVVTAASGAEGVAAFERVRPDCVLLDVRMPDLDGLAVCTRIRALPGGADTPILFLTALREVDTFDAALRAGADDFLTKPVRATELVIRVQAALKLGRLSSERRELYETLRKQRDDLMRLQLQKERLTAFLVHDLKNPVNGIELNAVRILREADLAPRSRDAAARIRGDARTLLRLIMNLLDISKADEGVLVPARRPVDLPALVAETLAELAASAASANVALAAAVEVASIDADADLLRRVLENLVENAIRHAPDGSVVRVAAADGERAAVLRIEDAGPGVPAAWRERIFERFAQAGDEPERSRGGRGLGLAFCKLAVEAHGGRIWVEDGGPGAVFKIELPASR